MNFFRVYIEITNACGLKCDFCPPKNTKPKIMDISLFRKILRELQGGTREIAFHIMGDPLLNKNLRGYLDLAREMKHRVSLTTSGFYLNLHDAETLTHEAIAQLNISLNSFNKNSKKMSLDEYLKPIFSLIDYKLALDEKQLINLRLWNLDALSSEREFNEEIFKRLEERYAICIKRDLAKKESFRIAKRVRAHFDELFVWPSLANALTPPSPCHGLNKQLGILSDGRVVPCCLDYEGQVPLGNVKDESLSDIVANARNIAKGLKDGKPNEELCKRCSYRLRFGQ